MWTAVPISAFTALMDGFSISVDVDSRSRKPFALHQVEPMQVVSRAQSSAWAFDAAKARVELQGILHNVVERWQRLLGRTKTRLGVDKADTNSLGPHGCGLFEHASNGLAAAREPASKMGRLGQRQEDAQKSHAHRGADADNGLRQTRMMDKSTQGGQNEVHLCKGPASLRLCHPLG